MTLVQDVLAPATWKTCISAVPRPDRVDDGPNQAVDVRITRERNSPCVHIGVATVRELVRHQREYGATRAPGDCGGVSRRCCRHLHPLRPAKVRTGGTL